MIRTALEMQTHCKKTLDVRRARKGMVMQEEEASIINHQASTDDKTR